MGGYDVKLTKEQEVLLMVLVAIDSYRIQEGWKNDDLWEVSCELALNEGGYDLREKVKDLRALADAGLIMFIYDEDLEIEEGEEDLYDQIESIKLKDTGKRYIARMEESLLRRLASDAWESAKGWFGKIDFSVDSLIEIEINGIKTGDIAIAKM